MNFKIGDLIHNIDYDKDYFIPNEYCVVTKIYENGSLQVMLLRTPERLERNMEHINARYSLSKEGQEHFERI